MLNYPLLSLRFLLFVIFLSCSRTDCPWENNTEPFTSKDLIADELSGIYKVVPGSTDRSFPESLLSESELYVLADSTNEFHNSGLLHFNGFPYWDNGKNKNDLGEFYGTWYTQIDKGGIFSKDLIVLRPSFFQGKYESAKSLIVRYDIRMKNGKPLLVVMVLKDFENDSQVGHSFVYNSAKDKDACNYLMFERHSRIPSQIQAKIRFSIDSLRYQ